MLGLRPRTFNCQLENVKSQKGYTFNLVKGATPPPTQVHCQVVRPSQALDPRGRRLRRVRRVSAGGHKRPR